MDQIDKKELSKLLAVTDDVCISIYIPTYKKGTEGHQNYLRFKNAVSKAEALLKDRADVNAAKLSTIVNPAKQLLLEKKYWSLQGHGFAAFLSPSMFSFYRTPLHFKQLMTVNKRFHIKPLLPLVAEQSRYYLLTLTLDKAALFECSPFDIEQKKVHGLPQGLSDILKYKVENKQLQQHTGTSARTDGGTKRAAVFHGQDVNETETEDILQYLRAVEKAILPVMNKTLQPLLFCGLDSLYALYLQVNTYPHLITDTALKKNPEALDKARLFAEASELMPPYLKSDYNVVVEKYHNLKGTGKAGWNIKQILSRAETGAVDTLIVGIGVHQWGKKSENGIHVHDRKQAGDEDLLDIAAVQTLAKGGKVYAVRPESVPEVQFAVALYRY